jgi:transcriptional regulator with XRE-family HTH domain
MKKITGADARARRLALGLNQLEFWSKVGVIQSVGSRYETGRSIPTPVQMLLHLVHFEGIEPRRLNKDIHEVGLHLKTANPELYASLRQSMEETKPSLQQA